MDQNKTDLVMQFVLDRQPVWAECALQIAPGDTLMTGFAKNTDYDSYSNFFEVNGFDFAISLKESDQSTSVLGQQPARPAQHQQKAPATTGAFARWRSATQSEYKSIYYPLEFDKFTFERVIDSASPIFFQCCCTSRSFDSAVLVKRISQGDQGGVARPTVGYLRIDFTKVLITGVDWDDGDVVKEKCEFICQQMKITYRKQKIDGTINASGEVSAIWPNPAKDRSLGIRAGARRF
jgi:type VI protein secretion system component Hcp